jgi:hypothetical protein
MKLLFILLLLPCLALAQKGSINGKAFFIYNENVRNRADVGARVKLIAKNDQNFRKETTVDLQGNYSFDDLTPGEYMLVLTSKNTKEDPITSVESLMMYADFLNNWSDNLSAVFQSKSYDSLQTKIQEYKDARDSKKLSEKKLQVMRQTLNESISQFYAQIPPSNVERLDLKSPFDKMKFEVVKVGNKEMNVATEFGLSAH